MTKVAKDTNIVGGCLCGAVRYESKARVAFTLQCCCRQCQHITGTGHSSQFAVPTSDVSISGTVAEYKLKADSGNTVTSVFCPTCGSPLYKKTDSVPQFIFFHAATLDDPSSFKPQSVEWASCRQPWDVIDPALQTE